MTSRDLAIEREGGRNARPEDDTGIDHYGAERRPLCGLSSVRLDGCPIGNCGVSGSHGSGVLSPHQRADTKSHQQAVDNSVVSRQNNDVVRAVAADRAAGGPFESFLIEQDRVEAKRILNFWSDAQVS